MLRAALASLLFAVGIETTGRSAYRGLLAAARDPEAAQRRALERVLRALASTELGATYGYASIRDADELRRRVPIHDYEALRPLIARQIATGASVVTPTRPIMYARTSGTTGEPKLVPVTADLLATLRRAQRVFSYVQHTQLGAFRGRVLAISGALREETLPDGTPAGSATGLIYETMPRPIRAKYAVPAEVFEIEDYELRYALIARLALQHRGLSMIATANPSTILRLVHQIEADAASLAADLESGGSRLLERLPPAVAPRIGRALERNPRQARVLAAACASSRAPRLAELWPRLRAVMTWLGGSCATAAAHVRELLPAGAGMIDAGYVASEVRGTVVIDAGRNLALPLLEDVFFEFAPVDEWDAGARTTRLLHELVAGASYRVLVTTLGGLVRYDMNDIVSVTGTIGRTPTLAFVRKGRGVTNITGEKLTEDQVNSAMADIAAELRVGVPFFVVIADAARGGYSVYVEASSGDEICLASLGASLDAKLAALNIEYAAKRASGRLVPPRIVALRGGTSHAFRDHYVRKGQRESQFKVLTLRDAADIDFDFAAHASASADAAQAR
jgi:hypothetical protein